MITDDSKTSGTSVFRSTLHFKSDSFQRSSSPPRPSIKILARWSFISQSLISSKSYLRLSATSERRSCKPSYFITIFLSSSCFVRSYYSACLWRIFDSANAFFLGLISVTTVWYYSSLIIHSQRPLAARDAFEMSWGLNSGSVRKVVRIFYMMRSSMLSLSKFSN